MHRFPMETKGSRCLNVEELTLNTLNTLNIEDQNPIVHQFPMETKGSRCEASTSCLNTHDIDFLFKQKVLAAWKGYPLTNATWEFVSKFLPGIN